MNLIQSVLGREENEKYDYKGGIAFNRCKHCQITFIAKTITDNVCKECKNERKIPETDEL